MRVTSFTAVRGWSLLIGWIAALALFGFFTIASVGMTPVAMLGWSILGAPLSLATEAFARRMRPGGPAHLTRVEGVVWLVLIVGAIALAWLMMQGRDVPLSDAVAPWVVLVYGLFPVAVTLRALRTLAREPE